MNINRIGWTKFLRTILLHLMFWVIVVAYFTWAMGFDKDVKKHVINSLFYLPGHMIMVYPLLYFLTPKFLLKGKYLFFFLGIIVLVIICQFYAVLFSLTINTNKGIFAGMSLDTGRNVLPYLHVGGVVLTIKLLKRWYQQKALTVKIEKQKTIAELKLLKAQLHPHFLFNTLNNLYAHTLEFSPKAPEIVIKLSGLLRFMIYESNVSKIPLEKEIELLKHYIALEQLRYGDRLDISVTISGKINEYQIAPLLLLPFLENAFKYGTSKQIDQCWISFYLSMEGSMMRFKLVNSINTQSKEKSIKVGGEGLQNVKRRLNLLYKDKQTLEIRQLKEVYVVNLDVLLEELEEKYIVNMALS